RRANATNHYGTAVGAHFIVEFRHGSLLSSAQKRATADSEHLAIEGAPTRARQKGDRLRHVAGLAALAERAQAAAGFAHEHGHGRGEPRLDQAWSHGVDGRLSRSKLGCTSPNVADQAGFGGRIVGLANVARDARDRGEADLA